jgi:peptide methionine sulfoxide reductase MsrB
MKFSLFLSAAVVAAQAPAVAAVDDVTLITFDGAEGTTFKYVAENDPVMGGLSNSTFTVVDNVGVFDGQVKIVPSLQAPGFCFLHTTGIGKFHSAQGHTHLALTLRNAGKSTEFVQYKVSLAADTLNPQFKSYKADLNLSAVATEWTTINVPFSSFSNKWSAATGEPTTTCAEDPSVCITDKNLGDIYQFGFWAEGKAGDFHVEMKSIAAVTPAADDRRSPNEDWNNTCTDEPQKSLRWNVTVAGQYVTLPYGPPGGVPADETLADAICCDNFFRPFAEPQDFFSQPDVALFDKLDSKGETTFYDSVCGEPLFTAPQNRTFSEWKAESEEHGWPSFRNAEIIPGAITVDNSTGFVFSKCGTHLGSYLPDSEGDRYCLDLACLSGVPKSTAK